MADLLPGATLTDIANFLTATAALGAAAFGLVDASKAVAGGISNTGFGYVRKALAALLDSGPAAAGAGGPTIYGRTQVLATLRANWLNGVAKADQKAIAKSLIRLELTPGNAARLASATGVDAARLSAVAERIRNGEALSVEDINILGRFDAVVSAAVDFAYERADQLYRNASKMAAALVAVALAGIGGGLLYYHGNTSASLGAYLSSSQFLFALLVGAIATPLAPVAKDLSSSLAAAVRAVRAPKR